MRQIKPAFTLTETLIAMALIGVIAAITIPQVVKNLNRNQTGIILARAVEQIELGCQNIIQNANDNYTDGSMANTLSVIQRRDLDPGVDADVAEERITTGYFADLAIQHFDLSPNLILANAITNPKYADGTEFPIGIGLGTNTPTNAKLIRHNFKNIPASLFARIPNGTGAVKRSYLANDGSLVTTDGPIYYIDTNTLERGPNIEGVDIFEFRLLDNGKLIPEGEATIELVHNGYKFKD
ncbi:type II secretion system protein [bacterium]|nr:type II secretion system protein [bacterium]